MNPSKACAARFVALTCLAFGAVACMPRGDADSLASVPADPHSHAQPQVARVSSVSLDLIPDFTARAICGTAELSIRRNENADSVVLDARDLTIHRVRTVAGDTLGFALSPGSEFLGSRLAVQLPAATRDRVTRIFVDYETSPDAAALQWLSPAQTAGGNAPFLFTQGQAILTRTWIPTQDSPGLRQSYKAIVRVPRGMRAVMSARDVSAPDETDGEGRVVYRFELETPVPPYLFALAVGDIAFRAIGENTGVFAEPSVVERAASEFAEVDAMMTAAERLYGPYRWGRYDILVLPPSFPFGGMENPMLTFATPTILAGDRSLVSLVAHELAHSWSGNLVTNATWDDFWINEGFTTYIEARIMEELRGREYADMLRALGRQDLESAMGSMDAADTRLRLDTRDRDPDDAVTDIAYEKGSAFLQTVESVVGRERIDAWLRSYFDRHAFQPMTSERLIADLRENLLQRGEEERIQVQRWIYQPGLPANAPPAESRLLMAVDSAVATWNAGAPSSAINTSNWSTQEWLHFLRAVPERVPVNRLTELDRAFNLTASGNSEILHQWLLISVRNRYQPAFPALDRFLTSQGRRKYLTPLYTELMKTSWGRSMARDIYQRARPTYHAVSTSTIDRVVRWSGN
jgi:leukotriene-A4 hydrolase